MTRVSLTGLTHGPVTLGGGAAALQRLLTAFTGFEGGEVGVYREATGTYTLMQELGGGRCWALQLISDSVAGGFTQHYLKNSYIRVVYQGVDDTDVAVTKSGSWLNSNDSSLGGTSARTTSAGGYTEYTTPPNAVHVGARLGVGTVNGIHKVTINSDATLANQLQTAQQLVDAGKLDSSALVANGGTLNPNDRCYDAYRASGIADWQVIFAADLTPGTYTIRMTRTGYKNPSASDTRLTFTGFIFSQDLGNLSGANLQYNAETTIFDQSSVYEYAFNGVPTGGSTPSWFGNDHGYDDQVSLALVVDSVAVTPDVGVTVAGNELTVTRVTELTHADLTPAKVADVTTIYTMTPTSGLTIDWTLTWALAGTMSEEYVAMYPVNELLDTAANISAPATTATLTANDNSRILNDQSRALYAWDADGSYGAMLYITNLKTVANWVDGGAQHLFVEDRAGGLLNKIYLRRNTATWLEGDVWESYTQRRVQRFPAGANAALTSL